MIKTTKKDELDFNKIMTEGLAFFDANKDSGNEYISYSTLNKEWEVSSVVEEKIEKDGYGSYLFKIEYSEVTRAEQFKEVYCESMKKRFEFIVKNSGMSDSQLDPSQGYIWVAKDYLKNFLICARDLDNTTLTELIKWEVYLNFRIDIRCVTEYSFLVKDEIDSYIISSIASYSFEFVEINYKELFGKKELIKFCNRITSITEMNKYKAQMIGTAPIESFLKSEGVLPLFQARLDHLESTLFKVGF